MENTVAAVVAEIVALLRAEAARYEQEAREHREGHGRNESQSVRAKKRAQARALNRAADRVAMTQRPVEAQP